MKKLLTILAAIGLTASAGSAVVACGNKQDDTPSTEKGKFELTGKTEVEIGKTITLTFADKTNDGKDLKNFGVVTDDKDSEFTNNDIDVNEHTVTITGKSKGTVKIYVAANLLEDESDDPATIKSDTITITVKERSGEGNEIIAPQDGEFAKWIEIGKLELIQIKDASKLENLKLEVKSEEGIIWTSEGISPTGFFTVEGIKKGTADILVSASNADTVTFEIFVVDEDAPILSETLKDIQLGKFKDNELTDEIIGKAIKEESEELKGIELTFAQIGNAKNEGSAKLYAEGYKGFATVNFTVQLSINEITTSISIAQKDELHNIIQKAITDKYGIEVNDKDYKIDGEVVKEGTVKVAALNTSNKIWGEFVINVTKFDISDLSLSVNPDEAEHISDIITNKVDEVIENALGTKNSVDLGKDYKVDWIDGKLMVTTTEGSEVITGEFEIFVKVDISGIKMHGFNKGDDMKNVIAEVMSEIKNLIEEANGSDFNISGDTKEVGTITVSANIKSELIVGEFDIAVGEGTPTPDPTDINEYLQGKDLGVISTDEAIAQVQALVEENDNLKGKVDVNSNEEETEIIVSVKTEFKDELTGTITFTYKVSNI